jgi:hypothetical protein
MSSSLPPDVIKEMIKPDSIKIEMNIIKFSIDIEKYSSKKWNDILNKLAQNINRISKEEIRFILEQIVRAQRCEFFESKRILGVYERVVWIKTHFK